MESTSNLDNQRLSFASPIPALEVDRMAMSMVIPARICMIDLYFVYHVSMKIMMYEFMTGCFVPVQLIPVCLTMFSSLLCASSLVFVKSIGISY